MSAPDPSGSKKQPCSFFISQRVTHDPGKIESEGRLVAVDYGEKRVGLAMSDPLYLFPQPVGTYSPAEALKVLESIARKDGIHTLVVGWPLTEEGLEGDATAAVDRYIDRVRRRLPGVRVVRWDERYTSEVARERLRRAGPRREWKWRRGRVDTAAAAVILQEYMNERRSQAEGEVPL